jgi:hypothetical protein
MTIVLKSSTDCACLRAADPPPPLFMRPSGKSMFSPRSPAMTSSTPMPSASRRSAAPRRSFASGLTIDL